MRKRASVRGLPVLLLLFCAYPAGSRPADTAQTEPSALSSSLVQRAQSEVRRIQQLVTDGTLPKAQLEEARDRLADAEDELILTETLYGQKKLEEMTPEQADAMIGAAERRVGRQEATVRDRTKLLDEGIIAKDELGRYQDELDARERVLELARTRKNLLNEIREMARTEETLERRAQAPRAAGTDVMIRFAGHGVFDISNLPMISENFQKRFHRALPVSALGQTALHASMGLDHHNRVDVALNPDAAEGVWLRQFLERGQIPYLAFRSAVTGAATAPHIHIGLGSNRLHLAKR